MTLPDPYADYIHFIALFAIISFFVVWIAISKGFFKLYPDRQNILPITFKAVVIMFALYLSFSLLLAPILSQLIHVIYAKMHTGQLPPLSIMSWVQLTILIAIFSSFYLYGMAYDKELFKRIWKNREAKSAQSIRFDLGMGILTWLIAFPVVAVIGETVDMLLYYFFKLESYEQVAVRYLKMNLSSFETLIVPLLTILIGAPLIEEFLFRGCLQTYFKRYFGIQSAILLSSASFALFHFAPSQGIGNISLLITLFTFAWFLGHIYERQASLFASIGLHMAFNAFSTGRILIESYFK